MERILALDVGSVRIGVAMSDPLGITAQPLSVIDRRRSDALANIQALIDEYGATRIVVGLPLRLDGSEGPAVQAINDFVTQLRESLAGRPVDVETWDERLSTKQAERLMIDAGVRRQKRRQSIDKVAATLILQSYLDSRTTL
ncbi:MAG: Holliday junction resolvase RuvX [Myxococcota bacterium]